LPNTVVVLTENQNWSWPC